MVSSTASKIFSLAISLLVVVISLTGVALGATQPAVAKLTNYDTGIVGTPGKMARDTAGNFYVADFWGKRIVKFDRVGGNKSYIAMSGRPSAVAALPDGRLVVAIVKPQPYIVFYSQVSGLETQFGAPAQAYYNPAAIAVDAAGFIYVVDSGNLDVNNDPSLNVPRVRVYSSTGTYLYVFGTRISLSNTSGVAGAFKQPVGIAYEKQNGHIVVVDSANAKLQFFSAWNGSACTYVKSVGVSGGASYASTLQAAALNALVKFYNPTDVAFEYNGSALYRMYVAERGQNSVAVVDGEAAQYGYLRGYVNAASVPTGPMSFPSSVLFANAKDAAGADIPGGVLYVNNASTTTPGNVLLVGSAGGTVPVLTVALTMAQVDFTVFSATLAVSGTTTPANAVLCSVNGGTDVAVGSGSWGGNLTLVPGENYILCKSTLSGVTSYKEARTYYTGTPGAAPTVIIAQPSAGMYTNAAKVTVSGSSDTAGATVQLVNGLNNYTVATQTNASKNWSASVDLSAGTNEITVSAWKVGTAVGSATVTVNADYTNPTMTLSFLSDAKTTNIAVQNIDGVVAEANLSSIEVNGVTVPASARVTTGSNTYFSAPVTLVRGANVVTVKATDLAGNFLTTTTGSVTLTPELPGLTVEIPGDNSYMPATSATTAANGTVDPLFTTVNIPGSALTPSAGTWSGTFPTTSGFKTYEFSASAGSPTVTLKRTINANAAYAQLAITSPAADLATGLSSLPVSGSVAMGSATPQISVDGATAVDVGSYDSGTGAFSHTVNLLELGQGLHVVKVIANAATIAVRNILYDTTLPDITIKADSKISPTKISGLIDPSARISSVMAKLGTGADFTIPLSVLTFNPYSQAVGSVVWHANLNGYAYDSITFKTVSPAGNEKELTRKAGIPTGDVDGDGVVRLSDALAALRHVAGTEALAGDPKFQADVGALVEGQAGQDGAVDIADAVLILGKSYGLLTF